MKLRKEVEALKEQVAKVQVGSYYETEKIKQLEKEIKEVAPSPSVLPRVQEASRKALASTIPMEES